MNAGYVSQNIYLAAASMKLGTCAIGSMPNPAGLAKELKLVVANAEVLVNPLAKRAAR